MRSSCAVLLALLVSGCVSGRALPPVEVGPGAERDVWAALLRQHYVEGGTRVVVLEPDVDVSACSWDRPYFADARLWRAFVAANESPRAMPRDLDAGVPVAWFSNAEWHALPQDEVEMGWTAFHERFPGNAGHISLSGVGFSEDGRLALVFGSVGRASLSASGDFFLLRRDARGWRIVDVLTVVMA